MNLVLLTFRTIFDNFTINSILDCIFVVLTLAAVNFVIFYFVRRKAVSIIFLALKKYSISWASFVFISKDCFL